MDFYEKARNIIDDIHNIYGNREGTQETVAKSINDKYGTCLTVADVASVTQQFKYWHTVKRSDEKIVIIILSDSFRNHIE